MNRVNSTLFRSSGTRKTLMKVLNMVFDSGESFLPVDSRRTDARRPTNDQRLSTKNRRSLTFGRLGGGGGGRSGTLGGGRCVGSLLRLLRRAAFPRDEL